MKTRGEEPAWKVDGRIYGIDIEFFSEKDSGYYVKHLQEGNTTHSHINGTRIACLKLFAEAEAYEKTERQEKANVIREFAKDIYQAKVLVRYKGKYLLLKKVRDVHEDHIGGWEVPGGKIQPNEEPIHASLREIEEETELDCGIIAELEFLELEKNGITTHTHVYLADAHSDIVKLSAEHEDFIWVTLEEVDNCENVIYRDLLKKYIKDANKIEGEKHVGSEIQDTA